jgi:hypothetical protein
MTIAAIILAAGARSIFPGWCHGPFRAADRPEKCDKPKDKAPA